MLYLSVALILIFILHLIDKHNGWRGAAKAVGVLFALGVVSIAGVYGWGKYDARRAEKARQEQVKTCLASITEGSIVFVRTGDDVTNVVKVSAKPIPERA